MNPLPQPTAHHRAAFLGARYLDGPPGRLPRCVACGEPTRWTTPASGPLHPLCAEAEADLDASEKALAIAGDMAKATKEPEQAPALTYRQRRAIHYGRDRRRAELERVRKEIADAIAAIGWRRARPVVEEVLGFPVLGRSAMPWTLIGKRKAARIMEGLEGLSRPKGQLGLFEEPPL